MTFEERTKEVATVKEALERADRCILMFEDPAEAARYTKRAAEIAANSGFSTSKIAKLYGEVVEQWAEATRTSPLSYRRESIAAARTAAKWRHKVWRERIDRSAARVPGGFLLLSGLEKAFAGTRWLIHPLITKVMDWGR